MNKGICRPLARSDLAAFRRRLLAWYGRNARDLPWRKTRDPYRIWVSEIMLQQTQVETVKSYFTRFVERFPTVADLAESRETQVLRLWEGLGYYRRARQLHAAAKVIVKQHGGQFPTEFEEVLSLPGIGRYTAGAILSIALDQRLPILEANTIRLFARLIALQIEPTQSTAQQQLWSVAEQVLPRKRCGDMNQALMELGSKICTPSSADCDHCPVAEFCAAKQAGLVNTLPIKRDKVKFEQVDEVAVVIRKSGRLLLRHCQEGERWAGLWDFPRFSVSKKPSPKTRASIEGRIAEMTGLSIALGDQLTTIKHGVTKYRITLHCFEGVPTKSPSRLKKQAHLKWIFPKDLADYPLSTTGRKISKLF